VGEQGIINCWFVTAQERRDAYSWFCPSVAYVFVVVVVVWCPRPKYRDHKHIAQVNKKLKGTSSGGNDHVIGMMMMMMIAFI